MPGLNHSERHSAPDCADGVWHKELLRLMKADAEKSEALIPAVVTILEERIRHNDALVLKKGEFFKMNITVRDFLGRIVQYSNASPCCYAIGLVWLERLKRQGGELLTSKNYQRTVLGAIMLACKFLDDFYYSNKHWAQIGGIPTKELNEIEINLLNKLEFKLHIQREEYDWYVEELYSRARGEARGPSPDLAMRSPPRSPPKAGSPPPSMSRSIWSLFFDKSSKTKEAHEQPTMHRSGSLSSEGALSAMNTPRHAQAPPLSGSSLAGGSFSMPMSFSYNSAAPHDANNVQKQWPMYVRDAAQAAPQSGPQGSSMQMSGPQGGSMQMQRPPQQQKQAPHQHQQPAHYAPPQQAPHSGPQQHYGAPQQHQQPVHYAPQQQAPQCGAPQHAHAPQNFMQVMHQPMHCFQGAVPAPAPQQAVFFMG